MEATSLKSFTKTVAHSIVSRINDTLVEQGKTMVLELSFEGRKTYIQLVTRSATRNGISKDHVCTSGMTMARAFDWLNTFELAININ